MAAYGTTLGVEALVPAIGPLDGGNTPAVQQVEAWLEQGAATINRTLAAAGYTVPVGATATVYPELTALNELYAAAYALMARGLDTVQGTTENRSAVWMEMFHDRLEALTGSALPDVPQTPATATRRFRSTPIKRVDGYSQPWDDLDVDA